MSTLKTTLRRNYSLPAETVRALDYIASRVGVSSSALLGELTRGPVQDLVELVRSTPENPSELDVVRLRGKSVALVKERVSKLTSALEDSQ